MTIDGCYILVNRKPVACTDTDQWLNFQKDPDRIVEKTKFGHVEVSTVFLGWSHGEDKGIPILFETLVFDGEYDGYMLRYTSWDAAIKGHDDVCKMVNRVAIERENKLNDIGL